MSEREWQDISSAPKDGTVVDLWAAERDRYESYRVVDCRFVDGQWVHHRTIYDQDTLDDMAPLYNATHWMPRPDPPSLTESGPENGDSLARCYDRYSVIPTHQTRTAGVI